MKGFHTDEGFFAPRVELASLYIDQFPDSDIGRSLAAEHGVPIFPSIVQALTLGGKQLAMDGVLPAGRVGRKDAGITHQVQARGWPRERRVSR